MSDVLPDTLDRALAAPPPAEAPPMRALVPMARRPIGAALPAFAPNPLLDSPAPRTRAPLLFGLVVFLVFVVGLGVWSGLAPLAEAAIAPGNIKVEGSRRTIQHLEGGIVREILVRDGDKVTKGQVLLRLDEVQADSNVETLRAQRWALLAQDTRLTAEIGGARDLAFPPELLANPHPRVLDSVTGQRALFEARRASLASQSYVLQARVEQQRGVIFGAEGQLRAARQQFTLIRQEEELRRGLVQQGLARLPDLLAVQRAAAGIQGTIENLLGEIERARGAIAESERQMRQAEDQRTQESSTELREVRTRLAEAEERLRAADDVMTRREILAPEAGTVVNSRIFTVGAVLRAGDPILDLVPIQDRLVAEVSIQPSDIDVVYAGLRAEVRLPAFKQRLVPYLHGEVTWVAADLTIQEQTGNQFFRAHILIDADQIKQLDGVFLTPGMPVEAHVQLGERTFFRFLMQPVMDSFHRAFREQ